MKPSEKFKVLALVVVVVFMIALVGGFVFLEGTGRPTSSFLIFASSLLAPLLASGVIGYNQQKQGEQIETIKTNTNGTLSAEREKNAKLTALLLDQHGIAVDETGTPTGAIDFDGRHAAD